MSSVTPRAVPFYCPFCGEQSIRPTGVAGEQDAWRCESCDRRFELKLTSIGGED